MKQFNLIVGLWILSSAVAYGAGDGTISGTVKGPSGESLKGVFVQARSMAIGNLTVSVLSDTEGRYQIENLSPGEYQVSTRATGYQSDPPTGVKVVAGSSLNLTLKSKKVGWSDLTPYEAYQLVPDREGKQHFFKTCMNGCHGFVIQERQTQAGWDGIINYMKKIRLPLGEDTEAFDKEFESDRAYAKAVFTVDGPLPQSPADLPAYQKIKRGGFSDDAMKIVYVDYDMPQAIQAAPRGDVGGPADYHPGMPMQFPFCAAPDKDGNLWVAYRYLANKLARLNPITGEVKEFKIPNKGIAEIHMAVPAPDGTVWFNEIRPDKIAKWDPSTQEVTEFQATAQPGDDGKPTLGYKNAIRIDRNGYVWSSGQPLIRFNPETGKFKYFLDAPQHTYGLALDKEGSVWFTAEAESKIGKVDAKTEKVTTYPTPTPKAYPRRIQIDSNGLVWFVEYDTDKIGRFDPKAETFKEYPLPGPMAKPYAFGIDGNQQMWYASRDRDVLGRLDPTTGQVTEYPMPYPFAAMREFFLDSKGRLWFGVAAQNKIGYFYLHN